MRGYSQQTQIHTLVVIEWIRRVVIVTADCCKLWFVMSSTGLEDGWLLKSWRSEFTTFTVFTSFMIQFSTQWLGTQILRKGNVCLRSWFKEEITVILKLSLVNARTITLIKRHDDGVYTYNLWLGTGRHVTFTIYSQWFYWQ